MSLDTDFLSALRTASFRGVPFQVEADEGEGGRRGKLHEYPFRDVPYAEDLGRRARSIQFRAFVIGALGGDGTDVWDQRDALIDALEQKGPGMLVHPSMGSQQMQVDPQRPFRYRETKERLRMVEFDLAFVEPGQMIYPTGAADTQAAVDQSATSAESASADAYVAAGGAGL